MVLLPGGASSERCGNLTLMLKGLGSEDGPIELRVCMVLSQHPLLVQSHIGMVLRFKLEAGCC